jgi:hypothetical protein
MQRVEDERIQDTKHNGVCADGHREGQNSDDAEAGVFAEDANGEPKVLPKGLHGCTSPRILS